jgi:hypothetical protein
METNVKTQGKNSKTASIKLQEIVLDAGNKLRVRRMQCSTRWGRNDFFFNAQYTSKKWGRKWTVLSTKKSYFSAQRNSSRQINK